ncbi:hypothetical protein M0813_17092 [Anaeramoeba flamelloides]|uniref:F-box domain-containing protein n=1 Tax=Anaeramoeba flamelloides TaxID=1746091 RepID=A0ABQ8YYP2_9EUKA|nr:hypothetical protein M0813_17092 [Anaeramoeba flamelloides]
MKRNFNQLNKSQKIVKQTKGGSSNQRAVNLKNKKTTKTLSYPEIKKKIKKIWELKIPVHQKNTIKDYIFLILRLIEIEKQYTYGSKLLYCDRNYQKVMEEILKYDQQLWSHDDSLGYLDKNKTKPQNKKKEKGITLHNGKQIQMQKEIHKEKEIQEEIKKEKTNEIKKEKENEKKKQEKPKPKQKQKRKTKEKKDDENLEDLQKQVLHEFYISNLKQIKKTDQEKKNEQTQTPKKVVLKILKLLNNLNLIKQRNIISTLNEVNDLFSLPSELLLEIFSKLPKSDLLRISHTCKLFYKLCFDKYLWRKLCFLELSPDYRDLTEVIRIGRGSLTEITLPNIPKSRAKLISDLMKGCPQLKTISMGGCDNKVLERVKSHNIENLTLININTLPPNIYRLKNLKTLDLKGSFLREFDPQISKLTNLKELHLPAITKINENTEHLRSLNRLTLLTTEYPTPNVQNLTNLKELRIKLSIYGYVQNKTNYNSQLVDLQKLQKLASFQLINFKKDVTMFFQSFPSIVNSLKHLKLCNNSLGTFPNEILHLTNLLSLDLSSNAISKIPDKINSLKQLTWLNLSQNDINKIPATLGDLKSLTYLNLNHNSSPKYKAHLEKFKSFRVYTPFDENEHYPYQSFFRYKKIQEFRNNSNFIYNGPPFKHKLFSMNGDTFDFTTLNSIYESIEREKIFEGSNLPSTFNNLINLQFLLLDENTKTNFPKLFLPSIRKISLHKNLFLSDKIYFKNSPLLNYIDFSYSKIDQLTIINCPKVCQIFLNDCNHLTKIKLSNVTALEELELYNTKISKFADNFFQNMHSLFKVYISYFRPDSMSKVEEKGQQGEGEGDKKKKNEEINNKKRCKFKSSNRRKKKRKNKRKNDDNDNDDDDEDEDEEDDDDDDNDFYEDDDFTQEKKITKIPSSLFIGKKYLKSIIFENHLIKSLNGIEQLQNLEFINFSNNQITAIPKFHPNNRIKKINLDNNRIQKIENFENLTSLKILTLANNMINKISTQIKFLKRLRYLNLSNNLISDIDLETLESLNQFNPSTIINLSKNLIDYNKFHF